MFKDEAAEFRNNPSGLFWGTGSPEWSHMVSFLFPHANLSLLQLGFGHHIKEPVRVMLF